MSDARERYEAARALAAEEKALALASFSELKDAVRPLAVVRRAGGRVGASVAAAGSKASRTVRRHPVAVASMTAGAGLALAAKPIGRFLAEEFDTDHEDVTWAC